MYILLANGHDHIDAADMKAKAKEQKNHMSVYDDAAAFAFLPRTFFGGAGLGSF